MLQGEKTKTAEKTKNEYELKLQQIDTEKEKVLGEATLKLKEASMQLKQAEQKSLDRDEKMT